ncbi:hypothetical protein [Pseudomonas sp. KNUC1026]|uniref:hypothetical protein n=1 Tax=Pseudomonas sp. KNUC1026 TaxID=2893890 RepID=UPI001F23426E|nr:hypothetical protein [Pseudomonas sp. KNUC1026]UFH50615.1 hypothetical protein LN139_05380 [Pseudomonas sp. KNUC1026]
MNGINSLPSPAALQPRISSQGEINKTTSPDRALKNSVTQSSTTTENQISSFSRALSDVASRAAERDANSSRNDLARIAQATIDKVIIGSDQKKNKAAYDIELPNPEDPQRLAQARQATNWTNGKGNNPFKGLPPDQLALIAYDESGTFTTNERNAAWSESYSQDQVWRRAICAKMMDDYNCKGRVSSNTYQEILDYCKALPPIEEAQISEGYDVQLQTLIDQNSADVSQGSDTLESIFDLLIKRLNDRPI